jgi:hypothetical protein
MPEIHNIRAIGPIILDSEPTEPFHAARLEDLDKRAVKSPVYITDITPTSDGIVANKNFKNTVPASKFLNSAITDTENVRVHVLVQGAVYTPPPVTVNGTNVTNFVSLSETMFQGYVDITVAESGEILAVNEASETEYTVSLTVATQGPSVTSLTIGSLPGAQTEVKSGDVVTISGIVGNDAVSMQILDSGAAVSGNISNFGAADSASAGFRTFSGTFITSNRSGSLSVTVTATNFLGTVGEPTSSSNTVVVSQLAPTVGTISVNYPNGQGALTNGDIAQVSSTITNADSVQYAFSAAGQDLTITDPDVYEVTKVAQLNTGTYHVSNNYTITATRAANGAVTTRSGSIRIAETAATATITVQGNPARLRTSASGENYILRVQANQLLAEVPTVNIAHGAWQGDWSFSGGIYSRTFRLTDADPRGDLSVTSTIQNLGSKASNPSATLVVGGLVQRTITFPAFARYASIGSSVAIVTKTRARYAGGSTDLTRRLDTTDVAASFTIVNADGVYDPNGTHLFLSDSAYAGANTSGTLQVDFEEII